jgi:DNA-3-methyladenine glycosylase II
MPDNDELSLMELPAIRAGLDALATLEPRFAALRPALKFRRRDHGFAGLVRIILGQQVSTVAADAMWNKLALRAPTLTPATLLFLDDDALAACGFSRQKIRYVRALATAIQDGSLDLAALERLDDEAVVEALTALPGFGRWSAEMFLIFCLGRGDVWPAGDLGVVLGLQSLHGHPAKPAPAAAAALGDGWRPHRTAAALYLWQHYHQQAALKKPRKKAG